MLFEEFAAITWKNSMPKDHVGVCIQYLEEKMKYFGLQVQKNSLSTFSRGDKIGIYTCISSSPEEAEKRASISQKLTEEVIGKFKQIGYEQNGHPGAIVRKGIIARPEIIISHLGLTFYVQ